MAIFKGRDYNGSHNMVFFSLGQQGWLFLRVAVDCSHTGQMLESLRVEVSDGDLVHQALLGRNCKIVLLSDFFFKIKMKT